MNLQFAIIIRCADLDCGTAVFLNKGPSARVRLSHDHQKRTLNFPFRGEQVSILCLPGDTRIEAVSGRARALTIVLDLVTKISESTIGLLCRDMLFSNQGLDLEEASFWRAFSRRRRLQSCEEPQRDQEQGPISH
ncbi:hypothetical protein FPOAC2_00644 [Fusarium poae]|jgi:hypothetical protein|uniref:hypothetical protein n=1 Tax=Fusarium poae TaxID=36050 RepID=UPI001CE76DA6|nr:hypothetical protein FPOAC1_000585 [Fusarium poae]KAG8674614.1 hypothetical protein FPOAC1_000585 [Fusarium poae]